jgi:catechol 2,3-dioxygenase-like lactoylglutathione lyase family enzyme
MSRPIEQTGPEPQRAHAVLHSNLNTVDLARAESFYTSLFGLRPRMRSVSTDSDATAMGLGDSTASDTCFLYDRRGPRRAPALELVEWHRPATVPSAGPTGTGFAAVGYRVPSLAEVSGRLAEAGLPATSARPGRVRVRGRLRPALRATDPDGVPVEIVEIPPAPDDPDDPDGGLFSHERLRCRDLGRTAEWYAAIGFAPRPGEVADGPPSASLVLPEDPTFSLECDEHRARSGPRTARAANTQGVYRIALAVDDVRAAHAALSEVASGVPEPVFIPMPDTPTGGFTVLFLADPDGAVVELVERPRASVRRPGEPR